MDVSGDAGAGGFADVHAEIDAIGVVNIAQYGLEALGKRHHFIGGLGREVAKLIEVGVGHDHHVAGGVGIGVEDNEAVLAAMNDEGFLVVVGFHGGAEDATDSLLGSGDVGVAPGSPEVIHGKGQG